MIPKRILCKGEPLIMEFLGGLLKKLPFFSHFVSLFLTCQTPSDDDFSKDESLKPLPRLSRRPLSEGS